MSVTKTTNVTATCTPMECAILELTGESSPGTADAYTACGCDKLAQASGTALVSALFGAVLSGLSDQRTQALIEIARLEERISALRSEYHNEWEVSGSPLPEGRAILREIEELNFEIGKLYVDVGDLVTAEEKFRDVTFGLPSPYMRSSGYVPGEPSYIKDPHYNLSKHFDIVKDLEMLIAHAQTHERLLSLQPNRKDYEQELYFSMAGILPHVEIPHESEEGKKVEAVVRTAATLATRFFVSGREDFGFVKQNPDVVLDTARLMARFTKSVDYRPALEMFTKLAEIYKNQPRYLVRANILISWAMMLASGPDRSATTRVLLMHESITLLEKEGAGSNDKDLRLAEQYFIAAVEEDIGRQITAEIRKKTGKTTMISDLEAYWGFKALKPTLMDALNAGTYERFRSNGGVAFTLARTGIANDNPVSFYDDWQAERSKGERPGVLTAGAHKSAGPKIDSDVVLRAARGNEEAIEQLMDAVRKIDPSVTINGLAEVLSARGTEKAVAELERLGFDPVKIKVATGFKLAGALKAKAGVGERGRDEDRRGRKGPFGK